MNISNATFHKKHIFLVSLGGMLELFDFTIYALLASTLGTVFFSETHSGAAMVNTFLVFAIGYFARPLGGILFSHFGDRYGRKNAFQSSIFIMALATLLVAFLPTYHQIGILAPVLLISVRLLQGLSLGGEVPGASVFVFEHYRKSPGFAIGIIFMSLTLGNVIAVLLIQGLNHFLNNEQMLLYGWRLAFILGSLIGIIGFILRRKISETPEFSAYKHWISEKAYQPIPLFDVFKQGFLPILSGMGLMSLTSISVFFVLSLPTYLSSLSSQINGSLLSLCIFSTMSVFAVFFGALSDKINRSLLLISGAILTPAFAASFIESAQSSNTEFTWIFGILFAIAYASFNCPSVCKIVGYFPVAIRYTGTAISYNLGVAIFLGIAPLSQLWLKNYMPITSALIILLLFASIISIMSVLMGDRFTRRSAKILAQSQ